MQPQQGKETGAHAAGPGKGPCPARAREKPGKLSLPGPEAPGYEACAQIEGVGSSAEALGTRPRAVTRSWVHTRCAASILPLSSGPERLSPCMRRTLPGHWASVRGKPGGGGRGTGTRPRFDRCTTPEAFLGHSPSSPQCSAPGSTHCLPGRVLQRRQGGPWRQLGLWPPVCRGSGSSSDVPKVAQPQHERLMRTTTLLFSESSPRARHQDTLVT